MESPPPARLVEPVRNRNPSLTDSSTNSRPPLGAWDVTGEAFGRAPSYKELRKHSVGSLRTNSSSSTIGGLKGTSLRQEEPAIGAVEHKETVATIAEGSEGGDQGNGETTDDCAETKSEGGNGQEKGVEENGGEKPGTWAVTKEGLKGFWRYFCTPLGFCVTIYMLNIIAWGGMLFLLLCNAAPAMCKPNCTDINSPRRIWIEIDSQILNALFCVTGFGLIPWRFRDLFYLLSWRCFGNQAGYLKLQEINDAWYRPAPRDDPELPHQQFYHHSSSSNIPASIVCGTAAASSASSAAAVSRKRAPPTNSWKLDFVIWLFVWNTFLQVILSGFMWGMSRYKRPSWSTGLFVALACIVAGLAGGMVWWETRKVKLIEGDKKSQNQEQGEKCVQNSRSN